MCVAVRGVKRATRDRIALSQPPTMSQRFASVAVGTLFRRSHDRIFYIMSRRSYVVTPSQICESNQGPLAFLFGWAGSKDSHLAKYSKFYEENDMTTVRYITPIFLAGVPGPSLSRPLLPAFNELNATRREIIFHLFSMNGCMMLTSLWQALDQEKDGRRIKEQIKGIVFDSCPSYTKLWGDTKVMAQTLAPGESANMQMIRRAYLLPILSVKRASTYLQSFWDPKIYEHNSLYYRMLSYTGSDMPRNQLYLYSKADFLCGYETIDQFREEQTRRGNNVDYIRFEDSPHVEHGRKYPEQYRDALRALCKRSLANFDESTKRKQFASKL